jgi:hypothetical protein
LKKEKERHGKYLSNQSSVEMEFSAGSEFQGVIRIFLDDSKWQHPLWPNCEIRIREEKRGI